MESLSFFTKNEQNSLSSYHTLLFYVYAVKLIRTRIISGPQSLYFMINFFAIERNEGITSKKFCESKHRYILYQVELEFHRHAQFHITTPHRVIRIMHYSPTLWHIPAPAVCTRTLAEGVHSGDL